MYLPLILTDSGGRKLREEQITRILTAFHNNHPGKGLPQFDDRQYAIVTSNVSVSGPLPLTIAAGDATTRFQEFIDIFNEGRIKTATPTQLDGYTLIAMDGGQRHPTNASPPIPLNLRLLMGTDVCTDTDDCCIQRERHTQPMSEIDQQLQRDLYDCCGAGPSTSTGIGGDWDCIIS